MTIENRIRHDGNKIPGNMIIKCSVNPAPVQSRMYIVYKHDVFTLDIKDNCLNRILLQVFIWVTVSSLPYRFLMKVQ